MSASPAGDELASLGVMRRIGLTPFAVREVAVPEVPHQPMVVWSLARDDRQPAR